MIYDMHALENKRQGKNTKISSRVYTYIGAAII